MQDILSISSPDASLRSGDTDNFRRGLWILMAAYAALFLLCYPLLYTSLDESANFGMAYVLRHGTIFPAQVGYALSMSPMGPHGLVYRFPIGYPLALAGLTWIGWPLFFLLNPVLHLWATRCFARLLQAGRIPVQYAALYLFYPGFVLYQRTLFSDGFAASLTTIALSLLLKPQTSVWAGACLGLALLSRSTSLLVSGIILIGLIVHDARAHRMQPFRHGRAVRCTLGLLPFILATGAYNFLTMGSPLHSTYGADLLSAQNLPRMAPLYGASLLLLFPGMLLAPLFYRGRFWREGLAASALVLLIACLYHESTYGSSRTQTLVSIVRQVLPVLPFFLLAYCGVLNALVSREALRRAGPWVAAALLLAATGLSVAHQKYLRGLEDVRVQISDALPPVCTVYANKDAFKIHQPVWDSRRVYRELSGVDAQQAALDLRVGPVYVAQYVRTRGVPGEDIVNAESRAAASHLFVLGPSVPTTDAGISVSPVTALRSAAALPVGKP